MTASLDPVERTNGHAVLSIVVPVYNEVATVARVLEQLQHIELPIDREIIVVDDGSTDGTGELLAGFERRLPSLRVFRNERNQGKGAAVRLGMSRARGAILAIQDADMELDPQQLAGLVAPILSGETDVVFGSRFMDRRRPPMPRLSYYANRTLTGITNLLYGSRLTDMETCYKVMRIGVVRSVELTANRFDFEEVTAKILRKGYRVVERPVKFIPRSRAQGKKIGWRDAVQAVGVLCRCRLEW